LGSGEGGWGIGDWGLGIGPNPQSPIPNPQSPIPNPHDIFKYLNKKYFYFNDLKNNRYNNHIELN